jgi:uncharacterized protein (TIGR02677 family)
MYAYLTATEARAYFAIMRVFSATLMADMSAADVSIALAPFERDGWIEPGESAVDSVLSRLVQLTKWGNLTQGRREANARSIAEFSHGSVRYQVDKLALRVHREAEEVLEIPLGAREVSREMLPAIQRGMEAVRATVTASFVEEHRSGPESAEEMMLRDRLSEQVTTLFLQHGELADTVRDFYAYVGQVVARHDLAPREIAGLRGLLAEYIQLVVDDVLQYTALITDALARLQPLLADVLRLLSPTAGLGDSVERARGRSASDWQGLGDWFVSRPGRVSQVEALRDATSKAIGSLLANVKRATGGAGIAPGQRAELISLARQFDESTVEGAHALYAQAFGLWPARHWHLAPEADETLPTVPWRNGAKTLVTVPVSSQGDRSTRGRTARIVEDPLGEQLALEEAQRQARQLEAAYTELRAASASLDDVTLSAEALAALYDLLRRAMGQLDSDAGVGEFSHAHSRLRVRVRFQPGTRTRVRAETGTLTLVDAGIDMLVL